MLFDPCICLGCNISASVWLVKMESLQWWWCSEVAISRRVDRVWKFDFGALNYFKWLAKNSES